MQRADLRIVYYIEDDGREIRRSSIPWSRDWSPRKKKCYAMQMAASMNEVICPAVLGMMDNMPLVVFDVPYDAIYALWNAAANNEVFYLGKYLSEHLQDACNLLDEMAQMYLEETLSPSAVALADIFDDEEWGEKGVLYYERNVNSDTHTLINRSKDNLYVLCRDWEDEPWREYYLKPWESVEVKGSYEFKVGDYTVLEVPLKYKPLEFYNRELIAGFRKAFFIRQEHGKLTKEFFNGKNEKK